MPNKFLSLFLISLSVSNKVSWLIQVHNIPLTRTKYDAAGGYWVVAGPGRVSKLRQEEVRGGTTRPPAPAARPVCGWGGPPVWPA